MIISKTILDRWKKKPPSCFISTEYGKKKKHTSGRRETRLGYYQIKEVTVEQASKITPYHLFKRRVYIRRQNGQLRRVPLEMVAYIREQLAIKAAKTQVPA